MSSICDAKAYLPETFSRLDDFEDEALEFAGLVETRYRDSLVLAQVREAEEEDFARRKWQRSFVARLGEFLDSVNDDSPAALSLRQALDTAEDKGQAMLVWLGPLARHWLRKNAKGLREWLNGRYMEVTRNLWEK